MNALPISLLATSAMRPVASDPSSAGPSTGTGFAALMRLGTDAARPAGEQRQIGAGGGGALPVATLAPDIGPDILVLDDALPIDDDVPPLFGIPPLPLPPVGEVPVPTASARADAIAPSPPTAPKRVMAAPSPLPSAAGTPAATAADDLVPAGATADVADEPDGQPVPAPPVAIATPDAGAAPPPLGVTPPTPDVPERPAAARPLASSGAAALSGNRDQLDRTREIDETPPPPAVTSPAPPLPLIATTSRIAATSSGAATPPIITAASVASAPIAAEIPIAAAARPAATKGTFGADPVSTVAAAPSVPKMAPPALTGMTMPASGGSASTVGVTGNAAAVAPHGAAASLPPAPLAHSPLAPAPSPVAALPAATVPLAAAPSSSPSTSPVAAARPAIVAPAARDPDLAAGTPALTLPAASTPTPGPSLRAGDRAPAAQLFAAAIRSADRQERGDAERDRSADPAAALVGLSVAATPPVQATSDRQPGLDLTRHDWPGRMIEHIETLRDAADATSTRIRLSPDALGGIDVSLHRQGDGTVQVALAADRAGTQTLIADAQPELARLGEARGLRFADSSSAFGGGGGASAGRSDPRQPRRPARPLAAAPPPATEPTHPASVRLA